MLKKTSRILISLFLTLVIAGFYVPKVHAGVYDARELRIATWNLWDFAGATSGVWKEFDGQELCSDNYVCQGYYDVITYTDPSTLKGYDVIFVQEIKGNYLSFLSLCSFLEKDTFYTCKVTENMGTTSGNNEGYGVIYKKDLEVNVEYTNSQGVVPHFAQGTAGSSMARPPMKATVKIPNSSLPSGITLTVFNNHIKTGKGNVERELSNLESELDNNKNIIGENVIVLGDLNADGGTISEYGKGRCNNYYYEGGKLEMDATYDDSDEDGDLTYPESDVSDYYTSGSPSSNVANNFTTSTDENEYSWGWIIENGFNLTLGSAPIGTSQGTNFPNAATELENRGCVYDRIIASETLLHKFSGKGVIGTIPKNINNVTSPRGKDDSVTETTIPAGTPFKDYLWNGPKGKDVYGLSDHKLVWADFRFAGISPTKSSGEENIIFESNEQVFFRGAQFQSRADLNVYVTPVFAVETDEEINLPAITQYTTNVTTNDKGTISKTGLRSFEVLPGEEKQYLIVVDVDGDNFYDKNIDVQALFIVRKDKSNKRSGSIYMSNDITNYEPIAKRTRSRSPVNDNAVSIVGNNIALGSSSTENFGAMSLQDPQTKEIVSVLNNVELDAEGNFVYVWNVKLNEGIYNILFHPYEEGPMQYNPQYDVIDFDNQIGFIVTSQAAKDGFNDLVTIGDNGDSTETFQVSAGGNIYILAKNLPKNQYVDIYAVNKDKLPDRTQTWKEVQDAGNVELLPIAVPLNSQDKMAGKATLQVKTSDDKGELFAAIAINLSSFIDQDYLNIWGKKLNVIIDVNRNGIFDNGDFIDTHEVDKILANINNVAGNSDATKQYQELLNAKLNLKEELVVDGIYGDKTKSASQQYICSANLASNMSETIARSSEIGFKVLLDEEYISSKKMVSGIYNYAEADFNDIYSENSSYVCIRDEKTVTLKTEIKTNLNACMVMSATGAAIVAGTTFVVTSPTDAVNPIPSFLLTISSYSAANTALSNYCMF